MSYKSLYRKYRPINFDSVYGQDHIVKILENCIKNNKIGHAYLFTGTRGTGKTTTAKIFARMVNCLNKNDGLPCGECEICKCENTDEIQDIIEIDAASNNGVDEIRELRNKVKLVPSMCKYKVYIIDEVHMLSVGAFNALLKTLEEPPEHVIFILATTDPQKLPITVISRCQRFDFKKINESEIVKRLTYISECENIDIEKNAIEEIAKMCDGALRDAIGLLDQLSTFNNKKITKEDIYLVNGSVPKQKIITIINYYINKDYEKLLNIIEEIYNEGKNFLLLCNDMMYLFRDALIYKRAKKYFDSKDIILKEDIINISNQLSDDELEKIINKLEKTSVSIKDSNYPRILFEIFLMSDFKKAKENIPINVTVATNNFVEEKILNNSTNIINKTEKIISDKEKEILINNTIYGATANNKNKVITVLSNIDDYLVNKKLEKAASILKDATVAAASNDHVLLIYKYSGLVLDNDNEIKNIEKIFSDKLFAEYKVVGITKEYWDEVRPKYLELSKLKKIKYIEESNTTMNVENDFLNIIEEG